MSAILSSVAIPASITIVLSCENSLPSFFNPDKISFNVSGSDTLPSHTLLCLGNPSSSMVRDNVIIGQSLRLSFDLPCLATLLPLLLPSKHVLVKTGIGVG